MFGSPDHGLPVFWVPCSWAQLDHDVNKKDMIHFRHVRYVRIIIWNELFEHIYSSASLVSTHRRRRGRRRNKAYTTPYGNVVKRGIRVCPWFFPFSFSLKNTQFCVFFSLVWSSVRYRSVYCSTKTMFFSSTYMSVTPSNSLSFVQPFSLAYRFCT